MNCAVHTDVPATGFCRNCGKALCPQCTREVRGALYCEECLAGLLAAPPAPEPGKAEVNPGLAATLGIIPGLGAVYNGQYLKALIHVLIFAGLIAALSSDLPDAVTTHFSESLSAAFIFTCPSRPTAPRRPAKRESPSPLI